MHLNEGVHPLPQTEWDGCGTTSQLATSIYICAHSYFGLFYKLRTYVRS